MKLCGVHTHMSTSRHPQTDGASEVMNRMVENYLRCYVSHHQKDWDLLLPCAEFAYNSAVCEDLGSSPFEIDRGYVPRAPVDLFMKHNTVIETVNEFKNRQAAALADARFCHRLAKARQSAYSAQKYEDPKYSIGDMVLISRALFPDAIDKSQASKKLGARRFGPFAVKELMGKNALRLDLPDCMKIHPVVHVSHTTPFIKKPVDIGNLLPPQPARIPVTGGELENEVDSTLGHRKRGRGYQFLTLLKGTQRHEA